MRRWSHGQTDTVSPEVCDRAVRLVYEHASEYPSPWAAITSIASKIGCSAQTLRHWIPRRETDAGRRAGVTSEEQARVKALEREVKALRRANGIVRKASVHSTGQRNSASNRAAGVSKSRRLRGRVFSVAATTSRSCCVRAPIDTPVGTYWRSNRWVFSLVPRCQGRCGSAKYTASPVFAVTA